MMKKKLLTGALSAAMLVTLCVPRTLLTKAEITRPVLVCEKEEHTHSAECYETSDELICGREASEGHEHDENCYTEETVQTCTREEGEDHIHDESCYIIKRTLTCEEKESAGHTHSDSCYKKELTCGLEEHKHDKACYETVEEETEEETTAPETEASTDAEETEAPETEESTEAAETETTTVEETTGAETPETSETSETKETEARECTCGTEDGIHDEDCPLYKETSKATSSNATAPTAPAVPVTPVHIEGCTDECTGEDCNCPCHRMSLFDRVMTCETLEDICKILDASTEEEWNALSEEEIAQINVKIEALEPEPYPAVVIDDTVEDTVQSEIVSLGVNISDVAPFRAPVEGGR